MILMGCSGAYGVCGPGPIQRVVSGWLNMD